MNITLNLNPDGSVTWLQASPQPVPAPNVPPVPQPTPQPAPQPIPFVPPPASQSFTGGVLFWDLHPVQLYPVPPLTGNGDTGASIGFVASKAQYPKGFQIGGVNEDNTTQGQDYFLSDQPYVFSPLNGNDAAQKIGAGTTMGPIYCGWGGDPSYVVPLVDGKTYYINYRRYETPRGKCSSQFVCYPGIV